MTDFEFSVQFIFCSFWLRFWLFSLSPARSKMRGHGPSLCFKYVCPIISSFFGHLPSSFEHFTRYAISSSSVSLLCVLANSASCFWSVCKLSAMFFTSGFLTAGNKKTAAIFLSKNYHSWVFLWWITIQMRIWDKALKYYISAPQSENATSMQMSTYEITSKQVLWLAPYRLIRPHFHILPSQFPND